MTRPDAAGQATDTLFDVPSHAVDDRTREVLLLIAGDPVHDRDRRRIVTEIIRDGVRHGGRVDMNRVRARLSDDLGNLVVYPRVIGAVVQSLARRGVLIPHGWVVNTDHRSGNAGRPLRAWRLAPTASQTTTTEPTP